MKRRWQYCWCYLHFRRVSPWKICADGVDLSSVTMTWRSGMMAEPWRKPACRENVVDRRSCSRAVWPRGKGEPSEYRVILDDANDCQELVVYVKATVEASLCGMNNLVAAGWGHSLYSDFFFFYFLTGYTTNQRDRAIFAGETNTFLGSATWIATFWARSKRRHPRRKWTSSFTGYAVRPWDISWSAVYLTWLDRLF